MASSIDIQVAAETADIPEAAELRAWAEVALASVDADADVGLTVRVVDEPEGRTLNCEFRGRDYATNVLSFPFADLPAEALAAELEAPYLGDLAICEPVVRREAAEQGKGARAHWAHMVVHGVLHLVGHDHQQEHEAMNMEAHERRILAGLGISDPYVTTTPHDEVPDGKAHG